MTEEEMQQQAQKMLRDAINEGRWVPRRAQRLALFVILPIVIAVFAILLILTSAFK